MGHYDPNIDISAIQSQADRADPGTRFILLTTLGRYKMQIKMLRDLQEDIVSSGTLSACRKGNSVAEYGRVAAAANSTAKALAALLKSIEAPADGCEEEDDDASL